MIGIIIVIKNDKSLIYNNNLKDVSNCYSTIFNIYNKTPNIL